MPKMMFAPIIAKKVFLKGDFFGFIFFLILLHLPPLRFHLVGAEDARIEPRTVAICDFGIGSQKL
jgi:hypothetical protein